MVSKNHRQKLTSSHTGMLYSGLTSSTSVTYMYAASPSEIVTIPVVLQGDVVRLARSYGSASMHLVEAAKVQKRCDARARYCKMVEGAQPSRLSLLAALWPSPPLLVCPVDTDTCNLGVPFLAERETVEHPAQGKKGHPRRTAADPISENPPCRNPKILGKHEMYLLVRVSE